MDCCSAGPSQDLDWLEKALSDRYEIKTRRIGQVKTVKSEDKLVEGQVLNRVRRRTSKGYELQVALRHAELIVEQMGLSDAKAVGTPGIDLPVPTAAWPDPSRGGRDEEEAII